MTHLTLPLRPALQRRGLLAATAGMAVLASACAPLRPPAAPRPDTWSGRLSLSVRSEPPQSFSSAFELRGRAEAGQLQLSTLLGTTLAQARWSPGQAWLQSGAQERSYTSIEDLLRELTGTALPLPALFDWLRGIPTAAAGWEADLAQRSEGRLVARRLNPAPQVELKLLLEQ